MGNWISLSVPLLKYPLRWVKLWWRPQYTVYQQTRALKPPSNSIAVPKANTTSDSAVHGTPYFSDLRMVNTDGSGPSGYFIIDPSSSTSLVSAIIHFNSSDTKFDSGKQDEIKVSEGRMNCTHSITSVTAGIIFGVDHLFVDSLRLLVSLIFLCFPCCPPTAAWGESSIRCSDEFSNCSFSNITPSPSTWGNLCVYLSKGDYRTFEVRGYM